LVVSVVERFAEEQGQHSLLGADHHMIGSNQAVWSLVMVACYGSLWLSCFIVVFVTLLIPVWFGLVCW
jgi:hypothetical protein